MEDGGDSEPAAAVRAMLAFVILASHAKHKTTANLFDKRCARDSL